MNDSTRDPEQQQPQTAGPSVSAEPTPFTDVAPGATGDSAAGAPPAGAQGAATPPIAKAPAQTLAGRVWVAIAVAAVLLILLIIFIAENTRSITISFLGTHGHISEALALLIAVVVGIVITLLVGSARIVQLTLEVRRHRRKLRELS